MQRRLLRSFVGIALVMIVTLGIPLGIVASRLVRDQAHERVQREADAVQILVDTLSGGGSIPEGEVVRFLPSSFQLSVVSPTGREQFRYGPVDLGSDPIVARSVAVDGTRITVTADGGPTRARVLRVWLVIAAVAVGALAVAIAVAVAQARRLSRPLRELAAAAARLGAGEFPVEFPAGGLAEIDAVSRQLRSSAERLGRMLERERAFSANASHQLRTALTALRLRLEELELVTDPARLGEELAHVVRQADRLEATVEELLAFARDRTANDLRVVRLDEVVRDRMAAWTPVFARAGRVLESSTAPVEVIGAEGAVRQALDVLLDNAARHGAGTVRVAVEGGPTPIVRVSDEGPGILAGAETVVFDRGVTGSGSTGIGLALARELVESLGGRLLLGQPRPPVFEMFLVAPGGGGSNRGSGAVDS